MKVRISLSEGTISHPCLATARLPWENEVVPNAEMQRRKRENVLVALRFSNRRVYGPEGVAERLGFKPTTLVSRIEKMGISKSIESLF